GSGDKIVVDAAESDRGEAIFVVDQINKLADEGYDWGDIAVFYRTNAQSRIIEDVLMRDAIPYRVVGGTKFYERAEIKDAIAYLRAVSNPDDTVSIRRVLNVPRRGIGAKAEGAIAAHASANGISFGAALE
ncbi:3'-5' exonuclease, partial [Pauljensenia sp. UMB6358]